jgi:hypothetical protein
VHLVCEAFDAAERDAQDRVGVLAPVMRT